MCIMVEKDTIRLLRECDAGIKMGVKSIDDVMDRVESKELEQLLNACKDEHDKLDKELQELLGSYDDEGKDPNFMAEAMAKVKTEVKLQMHEDDNTVADLITDGCNMGVKSLNMYLNQYEAADEQAKNITKDLIRIEDDLVKEIRKYL